MNRSIIYAPVYTASLALLLAACTPGPQQAELEPVTPVTAPAPGAPASEAPSVAVVPDGAASGGAAPAPSPDPQGTISISADNATFITSTSGEPNPVTVPAGSTFYLQLAFADPDGISSAQVQLRNSSNIGALPTGPFTILSNDCETAVESAPTDLTCTVEVAVAPDTQDIQQPGETAYAFRPLVTDTAGNGGLAFSWAYLNVEPQ